MPKQRPSTKRKKRDDKPWLPDPKSVVEVIDVKSPEVGKFRIHRTNIVDPYEPPLPAPRRPGRKR